MIMMITLTIISYSVKWPTLQENNISVSDERKKLKLIRVGSRRDYISAHTEIPERKRKKYHPLPDTRISWV